MHYLKYSKNFYSQNGEGGVIAQILKEIKADFNDLTVCEFGASDGITYSNTFALIKKFNAKAIYIEGSKKLFRKLKQLTIKYPKIIAINKYVKYNGKNSLDNILSKYQLKKKFDLLSIDIDSYDLKVWENFKTLKPKIVIIEINSNLGPNIAQYHGHGKIGNSFFSTLKVGRAKGYALVNHYGNLIFVKK